MLDTDIQDPWRCSYCNLLVYNLDWVDGVSYPAPGAPPHRYLSKAFPKVCILCFDIGHSLDESSYFMKIHTQWEEAKKPKSDGWK